MTTTVDAIYENGKLVLPRPLSLPEKSQIRVTIEADSEPADASNSLLDKTRRNRVLRELDSPLDSLVADTWEKLGPPPETTFGRTQIPTTRPCLRKPRRA